MANPTEVRQALLDQIADLPEDQLPDVLLFVNFLLYAQSRSVAASTQEKLDMSLLSESALAKDWLRPEEEAAWRDL